MPSGAIEMQRLRLRARGLVFDTLAAGPPTGEPVVLLHGFPQTAACWIRVAETLAAAGYRVLAPDQRGYSPGPGRGRCGSTGCRSWSPRSACHEATANDHNSDRSRHRLTSAMSDLARPLDDASSRRNFVDTCTPRRFRMSHAGYATAYSGWPESKTLHSGALTSPRPIVRDLGQPLAVPARTMRARRRAELARGRSTY